MFWATNRQPLQLKVSISFSCELAESDGTTASFSSAVIHLPIPSSKDYLVPVPFQWDWRLRRWTNYLLHRLQRHRQDSSRFLRWDTRQAMEYIGQVRTQCTTFCPPLFRSCQTPLQVHPQQLPFALWLTTIISIITKIITIISTATITAAVEVAAVVERVTITKNLLQAVILIIIIITIISSITRPPSTITIITVIIRALQWPSHQLLLSSQFNHRWSRLTV